MKKRHLISQVAGLLVLAASPGLAETAPNGFTSLFDGKDFSGWRPENPHDYAKLKDAKKIAAKRKKDLERRRVCAGRV